MCWGGRQFQQSKWVWDLLCLNGPWQLGISGKKMDVMGLEPEVWAGWTDLGAEIIISTAAQGACTWRKEDREWQCGKTSMPEDERTRQKLQRALSLWSYFLEDAEADSQKGRIAGESRGHKALINRTVKRHNFLLRPTLHLNKVQSKWSTDPQPRASYFSAWGCYNYLGNDWDLPLNFVLPGRPEVHHSLVNNHHHSHIYQ